MQTKWIVKPKFPPQFAKKLPGYHPVILQLFFNRNLDTEKKITDFLNPDYEKSVLNPFLFKQMEKAVARINLAIKNKDKILIYGDYDADGVTASAVLFKTLKKLKAPAVEVFIPNRYLDGYGLTLKNCQNFVNQKINLVITVDCGITNYEQIKFLKKKKIDVIITDHHLAPEKIPPATAVLNPSVKTEKYPFKKLSGVGVAFKLAQALFESADSLVTGQTKDDLKSFEKWLLDLVAIGTIGDVSPIIGENRSLIKYGLIVLNKTQRKGLQELIRICSLANGHNPNQPTPLGKDLYNLSVQNVAWQIVPRINAAGRIDHANLAYHLLVTEDEVEAIAFARDINIKNLARQKIAEQILSEAEEMFGEVTDQEKILIAAKKDWQPGVVGLVAGKLKDKYNRPVILFAKKNNQYSGSGRSIKKFNITEALKKCEKFLNKYGGHSQACGLTIVGEENYNKFKAKITNLAKKNIKTSDLVPAIEVEVELKFLDLNWNLLKELEKFEPYAEANPRPLFLIKNVILKKLDLIGKNKNTLRCQLWQNGQTQKAIAFNRAEDWKNKVKVGDKIDVVLEFGLNEWRGNRELQFKIIDLRKSS